MVKGSIDHQEKSRSAIGYAFLGVLLSLTLHMYFWAGWTRYAESIRPDRMAQRAGTPPEPYIAATTLSARDGAVVLLVSGVAVAWIARRYWLACSLFGIGSATGNIALGVVTGQVRGNLWPVGTLAVLLLTLIPVAVGGAIGGGLRVMTKHKRASVVVWLPLLLMAAAGIHTFDNPWFSQYLQ